MTHASELYACLYAKEFPAQALLRLRPKLRHQPCVVMDGEPPFQQVCSLNRKARSAGAAHGMTQVEIETLPSVNVLSRSLAEEASARIALLECAGMFSPRVEEWSEDRAFVCVLDIAGTEKLLGRPQKLAQTLLSRVRDSGVAASVTVSRNFHAAVCLARGMSRAGIAVIEAGEESRELATLPLSVLQLQDDLAETFEAWGIRSLGMLAALPEEALIARMGQEGARLRQLALGTMPHLFVPTEPKLKLEEYIELDSPVELLESLLFVVNVLLRQLITRASARVLALASVTIQLSLEGGECHARTVRPALPTNDIQLWIKLLHLDLEAHPPQAAILALTLRAESGATSKVQLGLFSPQLPEAMRLDVTLARIRAIVGEERVGRAVLKDTHQSDAFSVEPFSVPSVSSSVVAANRSNATMRRIRPATRLTVTLREGRPERFFFREKRYQVERAYGPWFSGGDWWNSMLWGEEQWDLVTRDQRGTLLCCCVTRDLTKNIWQMVALYD